MAAQAERRDRDRVPTVSPFLFRGFEWYSRRLVSKRFAALRVVDNRLPEIPLECPILVYANHASWWDPVVAVLVNQTLFAPRQFRAPIDRAELGRYAILERLGFFPVEQSSPLGAREFLRKTRLLLAQAQPVVALYITPHGQFVDARNDQPFAPGLAHVVSRLDFGWIVPLAVEYVFWNESTPEILIEVGDAMDLGQSGHLHQSKEDWCRFLQAELRSTQSSLADKAIARDPTVFKTLVGGRVGEGGLYDLARRAKAALLGQRFEAGHEREHSSQEVIR